MSATTMDLFTGKQDIYIGLNTPSPHSVLVTNGKDTFLVNHPVTSVNITNNETR
jgi:hypothetical protein